MLIVRQPLPGDTQARYDAPTGILYIDSTVPPHGIADIIAEAHHELLGNHDSAPHVRRRPRLRLVRPPRREAS